MPKVDSSAVERVEYSPESKALDIWYTGGDRYSYFEVPAEVYQALLASPSIGAFVNLRQSGGEAALPLRAGAAAAALPACLNQEPAAIRRRYPFKGEAGMDDRHDEVPPIVQKERRRGTVLAFAAIAVLLLVTLFFLFGEGFLEGVPPEKTDVTVKVDPGNNGGN